MVARSKKGKINYRNNRSNNRNSKYGGGWGKGKAPKPSGPSAPSFKSRVVGSFRALPSFSFGSSAKTKLKNASANWNKKHGTPTVPGQQQSGLPRFFSKKNKTESVSEITGRKVGFFSRNKKTQSIGDLSTKVGELSSDKLSTLTNPHAILLAKTELELAKKKQDKLHSQRNGIIGELMKKTNRSNSNSAKLKFLEEQKKQYESLQPTLSKTANNLKKRFNAIKSNTETKLVKKVALEGQALKQSQNINTTKLALTELEKTLKITKNPEAIQSLQKQIQNTQGKLSGLTTEKASIITQLASPDYSKSIIENIGRLNKSSRRSEKYKQKNMSYSERKNLYQQDAQEHANSRKTGQNSTAATSISAEKKEHSKIVVPELQIVGHTTKNMQKYLNRNKPIADKLAAISTALTEKMHATKTELDTLLTSVSPEASIKRKKLQSTLDSQKKLLVNVVKDMQQISSGMAKARSSIEERKYHKLKQVAPELTKVQQSADEVSKIIRTDSLMKKADLKSLTTDMIATEMNAVNKAYASMPLGDNRTKLGTYILNLQKLSKEFADVAKLNEMTTEAKTSHDIATTTTTQARFSSVSKDLAAKIQTGLASGQGVAPAGVVAGVVPVPATVKATVPVVLSPEDKLKAEQSAAAYKTAEEATSKKTEEVNKLQTELLTINEKLKRDGDILSVEQRKLEIAKEAFEKAKASFDDNTALNKNSKTYSQTLKEAEENFNKIQTEVNKLHNDLNATINAKGNLDTDLNTKNTELTTLKNNLFLLVKPTEVAAAAPATAVVQSQPTAVKPEELGKVDAQRAQAEAGREDASKAQTEIAAAAAKAQVEISAAKAKEEQDTAAAKVKAEQEANAAKVAQDAATANNKRNAYDFLGRTGNIDYAQLSPAAKKIVQTHTNSATEFKNTEFAKTIAAEDADRKAKFNKLRANRKLKELHVESSSNNSTSTEKPNNSVPSPVQAPVQAPAAAQVSADAAKVKAKQEAVAPAPAKINPDYIEVNGRADTANQDYMEIKSYPEPTYMTANEIMNQRIGGSRSKKSPIKVKSISRKKRNNKKTKQNKKSRTNNKKSRTNNKKSRTNNKKSKYNNKKF